MPRRSAEDKITQRGGVLRAASTPGPDSPISTCNPFNELEEPILEPVTARPEVQQSPDEIPNGLEGRYFF